MGLFVCLFTVCSQVTNEFTVFQVYFILECLHDVGVYCTYVKLPLSQQNFYNITSYIHRLAFPGFVLK